MTKILPLLALAMGLALTQPPVTALAAQGVPLKIGQKAPELAFNNPQGKTIVLSQINKGRYVLLDFWASWANLARHDDPALVALYNKYSGKTFRNAQNGFTIVSVSVDSDKTRWVSAIQADKLVWPYHMSDLVDWNTGHCVPANTYGVQVIPQAFLIDPTGKIIGVYAAGSLADRDLQTYVVPPKANKVHKQDHLHRA